jgi:hypothetical protein
LTERMPENFKVRTTPTSRAKRKAS